VPAPRTIYRNTFKLSPGTILEVDATTGVHAAEAYWSFSSVFNQPRFAGAPDEAVDELQRRLTEATRIQSIADVPLGAFLSGGIDSSTIVALMQSGASRPTRTFSIGFEEKEYNEAPYAAAVAKHLGTDHTELTVTSGDALALVPRLPDVWDEPFADSSQMPTMLVAALARRDVTVSLSGDAGDELFCGYDRYPSSQLIEQLPARSALRAVLSAVPHRFIASAASTIPLRAARGVTERRLANVAHLIQSNSPDERYIARMMQWKNADELVPSATLPSLFLSDVPPPGGEYLNRISGIDALNYLPDDILVKVDRAAMACSLETRVPLLDHRVVEFAFSLPVSVKTRHGEAKWPLRQILYKFVPRALVDRPKRGFGVPVAEWLRGPLRDWADDLLSPDALAKDGLLNPAPIVHLWQQHRSGQYAWENRLWGVLMFQAWRARYA
jgi:asparagine synthase (glutamine-hydrolysing)